MKKDIIIPKVEHVYIAAVREFNREFNLDEWIIYLINEKDIALEMIFVVVEGFNSEKKTTLMRHSFDKVNAKDFFKIEYLPDNLVGFTNSFKVSFFADGKLYDKNFVFKPNTINDKAYQNIPVLNKKGVLLK